VSATIHVKLAGAEGLLDMKSVPLEHHYFRYPDSEPLDYYYVFLDRVRGVYTTLSVFNLF
jgi:hypothetical protein